MEKTLFCLQARFEEQMNVQDQPEGAPVKGVPDFWLTVLKNHVETADMIQDYDEPILKHLTDIEVDMIEEPMVRHVQNTTRV